MTNASWSFFVKGNGLTVRDNRPDGALWVLGASQPVDVERQLKAWGFTQRAPRGWFKE
jgi:hypothetical protein